MAWPWVFESTFERGSNGDWGAEVDASAKLDFPHYSKLAGEYTWQAATPWKGAYCMRVEQPGTTGDAYVTSTQVQAVGTTAWVRFQFCVGGGWQTVAGTTTTFSVFRYMTTGTTSVAASVGLRVGRVDATSLELGVGVSVPTTFAASFLPTNKWHSVEIQLVSASESTTANGSIIAYVNGFQAAAITSTIQASAFAQIRFGILDPVAGERGTLLFDSFILDDTRLGPALERFSETRQLTQSGHLFVGPGRLDNLLLLSQAVTTSVAALYDTDQAGITSQDKLKARLQNTISLDVQDLPAVPLYFTRGCYVDLLPTAVASQPRVVATFQAHADISEGAKRIHGQKVKAYPGDAI